MKIQKLLSLLLFLSFPNFANAQETDIIKKWGYKGYAGGMFIHSGYVESKFFGINSIHEDEMLQQIKGITLGLGGKMGIFLSSNFRLGGEGYFSTCTYGFTKNYCRLSWGGFTFDFLYPIKKWSPFLGITFGGGTAKHHIFFALPLNNKEIMPIVYFKTPLIIINPSIGFEYFATDRVSLIFKMDYMFNIFTHEKSYPQGIRFYIGVHFYQINK